MVIRRFKVREQERGLVFRDGQFEDVLGPGAYWRLDPLRKLQLEIVDARGALFEHEQLTAVLELRGTAMLLEAVTVEAGHAGSSTTRARPSSTRQRAPGPRTAVDSCSSTIAGPVNVEPGVRA